MSENATGVADFDFLFGAWIIANERLISRLTGSTAWEQFPAVGACGPILGGIGNVDSFSAHRDGHDFEGTSLRLFNPETANWSIYWADNVSHALGRPVVGNFVDGLGEFFGDDNHAGEPVLVRFRWSEITSHSARWEQAFSSDRGETWETNWIMSFTRRSDMEGE